MRFHTLIIATAVLARCGGGPSTRDAAADVEAGCPGTFCPTPGTAGSRPPIGTCCSSSQICAADGSCRAACPPGGVPCGTTTCCDGAMRQTCNATSGACCRAGQVACGASCCAPGSCIASGPTVVCCDHPLCGSQCCGAGEVCNTTTNTCCAGAPCGSACCNVTQSCDALHGTCCDGSVCGLVCCPSGSTCDPTNPNQCGTNVCASLGCTPLTACNDLLPANVTAGDTPQCCPGGALDEGGAPCAGAPSGCCTSTEVCPRNVNATADAGCCEAANTCPPSDTVGSATICCGGAPGNANGCCVFTDGSVECCMGNAVCAPVPGVTTNNMTGCCCPNAGDIACPESSGADRGHTRCCTPTDAPTGACPSDPSTQCSDGLCA